MRGDQCPGGNPLQGFQSNPLVPRKIIGPLGHPLEPFCDTFEPSVRIRGDSPFFLRYIFNIHPTFFQLYFTAFILIFNLTLCDNFFLL